MSDWTHTLLVVVPEALVAEANKLALAIGTSGDDANTFITADWTDSVNFYAVANTKAVDQIMEYFALVPQDLSANVVFPEISDGVITGSDMNKIQVFVDQDPLYILDLLGLARI